MLGVRRISHSVGLTLALLLLGSGTAAACHSLTDTSPAPPVGQIPDYNHGDDFAYRLYFKSQGGSGSLSTEANAPSDPVHAKGDATTGLTTGLASMNGGEGYSVEFVASAPVADNLWFNLTKPLAGIIHVSSSSSPRDASYFRTTVWLDDKLIGGDECTLYSGTNTGTAATWSATKFKSRVEADKILAGQTLKVKVTFFGGYGDFRIGTGGDRQSFLELRVTSYDLLSTAVYLEANQLRFGVGVAPSSDERATAAVTEPSSGLGPLLLLALPLVGLARRRRATIAILVLVLGGLAGCVGGSPANTVADGSGGPRATVETSSILDPSLRGVGALQGYVASDLGLPIRGAHVVLIGTANFTNTDGKGFFKLPSIIAGQYKLRIDKEKFLPIEQVIRIESGKLLSVNVTMVPPEDLRGNKREHVHDDWGGLTVVPWWSGDVQLKGYDTVVNGENQLQKYGVGVCYYYYTGCTTPLPTPDDKPIFVGTGLVEVTLKWNPGTLPTDEVGLEVVTPKTNFRQGNVYHYMEKTYVARKSGETFRIYVFPDEADAGHQKYTKWTFNAVIPVPRNTYVTWNRPVETLGTIHADIKIHKARVVPEAPHKDFWGNLTEKVLMVESTKTSACAACDFPYALTSAYWYYNDFKSLIPPGTKEIQGTFRWESPNIPNGYGTAWKLSYKPGSTAYSSLAADWGTLKTVPGNPTNNRLDFVIRPEATEYDQFYATSSGWMFFPDDGQEKIPGTIYSPNTSYQTKWFLSLKIVKDPEYKD